MRIAVKVDIEDDRFVVTIVHQQQERGNEYAK